MKNPMKAGIRKAILFHHAEGMSYREIVNQLRAFDVTKHQASNTIKKFYESQG